jgi:ribonuclease P protein component
MASAPGWRRVPGGRSSSGAVREAASACPHSPLDLRVNRRHRLSRSRDFDAVYRQGRSVSTRFLVLYWFAREEDGESARLGLAVPKAVGTAVVRNRIKRRLRELFRERSGELPQDHDYVLVVRPGLAEAAENRGFDWLRERVDEILGKAQA